METLTVVIPEFLFKKDDTRDLGKKVLEEDTQEFGDPVFLVKNSEEYWERINKMLRHPNVVRLLEADIPLSSQVYNTLTREKFEDD